ncbi:MAG: hypothetical protein KHX46_08560 [Clostridiales bacterium]|nr:hypothetical protein [Clostridiales bacterium]
MKAAGKTNREIAAQFGFRDKYARVVRPGSYGFL